MPLKAKSKTAPKTLPPVRPNLGTQAIYRQRLDKLINEMNDSVLYWIKATYKSNEPAIAQDALPYAVLQRVIRKLSRRWQRQFDELGPKLAEYSTKAANQRTSKQFEKMLDDAGMTVNFKMTREMRDVMNATIEEQVGLIKSIPQQYFTNVQGSVMRSVISGRDLGDLSKELQKQHGITKRRAALISRDQNNKATASMVRVRQQELGIKEAIWLHSSGGKVPRPTHYSNNGKKYDIIKGWFDKDAHGKGKGAWIRPGELINCRCVSRSVVPGFE